LIVTHGVPGARPASTDQLPADKQISEGHCTAQNSENNSEFFKLDRDVIEFCPKSAKLHFRNSE